MRYVLGTLLVLFCFGADCQRGFELGGNLGVSYYFGDINYNLSSPGPSVGIIARRNFNERVSLATSFTYGQISASDENSFNTYERTRNLSFHSDIYDASFSLEFNFFPYIHGSEDYYYTPYLFGGFSVLKFNPTTELNGQKYALRDFQTEGVDYGLVTGAFVYGFGLKMDINRDWSINAQISGRNVSSDYIDDVSGSYPDFFNLGPEAAALSNRATDPDFAFPGLQRGNGKSNDVIYFVNIGIVKYFGTLPCPAISKNYY